MRIAILLFVLVVFLPACKEDDNGPLNGVELRLQNASGILFEQVFVDSGTESNTYPSLIPGMTSPYRDFDQIYRYAYIRISSGDKEYILQPIDYVGESPLPPGRYTYILDINDADYTYSVSLELRRD